MLGLRWPEWGETALTLLWAGDRLRGMRCACGCGQWADLAHDVDTSGWWDVESTQCYASAAVAEWRDQNKDMPAGTLAGVRLSPDYEQSLKQQ